MIQQWYDLLWPDWIIYWDQSKFNPNIKHNWQCLMERDCCQGERFSEPDCEVCVI